MKKTNNIFKLLGVTAIAGTIALFAACSNSQTTDTPVNNAGASQTAAQSVTAQSITLESAIEIALNHAGVERENARFTKTQLDNDDKTKKYEVDFIADSNEYEYEIAISDGAILKSEIEKRSAPAATTNAPVSKPVETNPEVTAATPKPENTKVQNAGYISVDDAMTAAIEHAGFAADSVVVEKASFDGDDMIPHYDIELYSNGYEYDYEINAKTGAVIEFSKEKEGGKSPVSTSANYISAEQAKEAALKHAGVNAADARFEKTELDRDDAIPHYEIEFRAGRVEYEYEVNAKTGSVIASEKDYDN